MTMFKLETMIYASEDGTSSVFTLNPALQKQLDTLASQHPEVCQLRWLSSLCGHPESDNRSTMVE